MTTATIRFEVTDTAALWDIAYKGFMATGGDEAEAFNTLGTRDNPKVGACIVESIATGDGASAPLLDFTEY